ncbi:MAG TPA: AtpZ/AtpI family protein [Dongiaceae bacterium]|nr:AtpZ/AtpI family protein [Dongiaceae bacterium]
MSGANDPESEKGETPVGKRAQDIGAQSALAMELPFTLVGAVVFGGLLGYFLDRWLHTAPWLMLVLGGLGFAGGVREVLRRLPK